MDDANGRLGSRASVTSTAWGGSDSGSRQSSRRTPSVQHGDEVTELVGSFSGSDSDDSVPIPGGQQIIKPPGVQQVPSMKQTTDPGSEFGARLSGKRTSEKRGSGRRGSGNSKRGSGTIQRPSASKIPAISSDEDGWIDEGYWVEEGGEEEEKVEDEMETSEDDDDWRPKKPVAAPSNIAQPPQFSQVSKAQKDAEQQKVASDSPRTALLAKETHLSPSTAVQNLTPSGSSSGLSSGMSGLDLPLSDGSSSPQIGETNTSVNVSLKSVGEGKDEDSSLDGEDLVDAALRSVMEDHAPSKSISDVGLLIAPASRDLRLETPNSASNLSRTIDSQYDVRGDHWGQGRPSLVKKEHCIDRLVTSIEAALQAAEEKVLRSVWDDVRSYCSLMQREQPHRRGIEHLPVMGSTDAWDSTGKESERLHEASHDAGAVAARPIHENKALSSSAAAEVARSIPEVATSSSLPQGQSLASEVASSRFGVAHSYSPLRPAASPDHSNGQQTTSSPSHAHSTDNITSSPSQIHGSTNHGVAHQHTPVQALGYESSTSHLIRQDHAAARSVFASAPMGLTQFRSGQPSDKVYSLRKRMAELREQLHRLSQCNDGLEQMASGCKSVDTVEGLVQAHAEAMGQAKQDLKIPSLADGAANERCNISIEDANYQQEVHHLAELRDYVSSLKTKKIEEPSSFQLPIHVEPSSLGNQQPYGTQVSQQSCHQTAGSSHASASALNHLDTACSDKAISDVWARFHPSRGGSSALWSEPTGPIFATPPHGQLQLSVPLSGSINNGYPMSMMDGMPQHRQRGR